MKINIELDLAVYPDTDMERLKRAIQNNIARFRNGLDNSLDWAVNKIEMKVDSLND